MLLPSGMPTREQLFTLIKGKRQHLPTCIALFVLALIYLIPSGTAHSVLSALTTSNSDLSRTRTAAIIETRPLSNLAALTLHFSSVLGPTWKIALYTTNETAAHLETSAAFAAHVASGRLHVELLPETENFKDRARVSGFLTRPWFWESLAPAKHVLLFQADSIICANAPQRAEDFLAFDFIGAPINPALGVGNGYNGGFSLRNVEFEDQWFFQKLSERPDSKLPSQEVASTFSVETLWMDKPLGYHQVSRWQNERMSEVLQWCPEYSLASQETLAN